MTQPAAKRTRAEINRENAQKSTGPKTPAGKQRSRMNAMRHGVTRQVMCMPPDQMAAYLQFQRSYFDQLQPQGAVEKQEVQFMVDAAWKINSSTAWQQGILSERAFPGMEERAAAARYDAGNRPEVDAALAVSHVVSMMTRDLCNLSLYESRLHRQYQKSQDRLKQLQIDRACRPALASYCEELEQAPPPAPEPNETKPQPPQPGFDFSDRQSPKKHSPTTSRQRPPQNRPPLLQPNNAESFSAYPALHLCPREA